MIAADLRDELELGPDRPQDDQVEVVPEVGPDDDEDGKDGL